ncbi:hypothetical protein AALD74_24915, partial [Lachnospiraceae bacterium 48-21]
MKHYLDLIKISAKQHRKQNRMTRLCIALAVFLVTVIFGMADMEMRSQYFQAVKTDGSWPALTLKFMFTFLEHIGFHFLTSIYRN